MATGAGVAMAVAMVAMGAAEEGGAVVAAKAQVASARGAVARSAEAVAAGSARATVEVGTSAG